MAPITKLLIAANIAVFLLQAAGGGLVETWFALWPPGGFESQFWQLVTYGFLHGSFAHIFFNMLALYMFGSEIERLFGSRVLSALLLRLRGLGRALPARRDRSTGGPAFPTVGASGGVYGLLLAFGIYFPRRMVMLIFPPIPMPARFFVILFAAVELVLGVTGTQAGVAHFAHLGGMLGGWLMIQYRRRRFPFSPPR